MLSWNPKGWPKGCVLATMVLIGVVVSPSMAGPTHTVARKWNDQNLEAIRRDFARPTVHARNLYHTTAAMWDAWAAYDSVADQIICDERTSRPKGTSIKQARREAMSHAAYRVLQARYSKSPGSVKTLAALDALMDELGYDKNNKATVGNSPAAVGNRIAVHVLAHGLTDGSNEAGGYVNLYYTEDNGYPANEPILPDLPGNPDLTDPNRWQPIALEFFIDQSGELILGGYPEALSPEWGIVTPFSLKSEDLDIFEFPESPDFDWWVYFNPIAPPEFGNTELYGNSGMTSDEVYRWGNEMVVAWSSHLDASDGVMIDISPGGIGNAALAEVDEFEAYYDFYNGGDWGPGHTSNPVTGQPYTPQMVPRGDYGRILAEFWADGPDSETPPGHWHSILNYVIDHPQFELKLGGEGKELDPLEFDAKAYVCMSGAMHDIAIAAWGIKGYYDYIRPVSAIRFLADQGQASDPLGPSYHPDGINLHPGLIEVVTAKSTAPGQRHEHLAGEEGKIAVYAWKGPDYIADPDNDVAGVAWILAEHWWPYQRPSFVTPPFPGYVSGHSTYSRGAAELMELMTGTQYFPGGMGTFLCAQDEFLVFEDGPSVTCELQWATYNDASDQTSLSRIWGGIHPPADDLPGRLIGKEIGPDAWYTALAYFDGRITCPGDLSGDRNVSVPDLLDLLAQYGQPSSGNGPADLNMDGQVDVADLLDMLGGWGMCPNH
jgi:hypothetical protein